jgi:hypothetical protein
MKMRTSGKYLSLLILLLATQLGAQDPNLIAYYPFTGSAGDSSGSDHHGTPDGAVLISDRFGNANRAFQFDGLDDAIRLASVPALQKKDNATLCFWFTTDDINQYAAFYGEDDGGATLDAFKVVFDTTQIRLAVYNNGWSHAISADYPFANDIEYFVAVVKQSQNVSFYIDGQILVTEQNLAHSQSNRNPTMGWLGKSRDGGASIEHLRGTLDDVRFYDRILADTEIDSLYHLGGWTGRSQDGLVAYYPFSGDAGDSSGNGNHGTVDGATPTTDRFGNANSAYLFFGKTDHVATNISTDDYNDVFSISVWMKSSDYHNAGQEIYLANNYDGAGKGWNLYFDNDESDYLYFLGDDQASDPKIHLDQFTNNTWYHVAAVAENGVHRLYIDGQLVDETTNTWNSSQGKTLTIGNHQDNISAFNGILDDFHVYDRALLASEIDSLYRIGGWDSGPSPDASTFFDDFSDGERSSNPTWSDFVNIPPAIFEVVQDPLDATNQVLRGVGPTFATHGEIHASWDPAAARNLNSDSTMWRYRFMIPSPYGQGFSIAMRILYNDDDFIGFYVIDKTNGNQMHASVFINGATQGETIYESDISYPLDEWLTFELTHAAASKQMQYRLTKDSDGSTIYAGIADFSAIDLLDIGDFNTLGIAAEVVRDHYIDDVEVSDWHDDRPPGLVAYYPFSGDAGDSSGNGNHGTVDGATLTSDRFGNPNQAFLFDGVNDYISATLDATEEFSVACWTKSNTTDYPGTANGTAIHMENGNQAVFLLQVDATNDRMRGRTYHGDYTIYDEAQIDLEWHFWVIKKDESHFFLYKDNSVVDSIAISLSQTANDLDFFVGQHEGGLRYWSGIIDDIRIYDRALAPGEIDSLYHIGGWDTGNLITFQVDMSVQMFKGNFDPASGDSVEIRGSFNSWQDGNYNIFDYDKDKIYSGQFHILGKSGDETRFKFVHFGSGGDTWEDRLDRSFNLTGQNQVLPVVYFSDDSSLILLSSSPTRNANNVPRDANIVLTFDQNLDPATVNSDSIIIRGAQTGPIAGSFSVDGPIATFDPAADFKAGEVIHVLATTGLQAGDGTPLAAAVSYQFTTLVSPAPESPPSFNDHTITTGADGANSVFAADVDGDGHIDVLSASYDDGRIAWYENDGSGGFTAHTITTGADSAFSVFAADVDGDGDMDVLSASRSDDKIAWYENDGSANFTTHTITTGARGAVSVFAADVDGDGDMDIMSSYQNDETIAWYENDGSQNFTPHEVTSSPNYTFSVFAADVDGDGDMDLLSSLFEDTKIAWYENDGNANFTANTITTSAAGAHSVFAADVDGDGHMDVLSASRENDNIAWYENDGSQNFTAHEITSSADGAFSVYAADMDGDGDMDVLSASGNDDKIAWYENDGAQNFTPHTITTGADGARSVFAADVDGDGDMDVLSASSGDDKIAWYENYLPPLQPVAGFSAQAQTGAGILLQWDAHPRAGHYLLYSNHGSGAIDTLSTWKTFNAGQISFDTTLTDGTWKFSIRLESSDGRKSPLSYASVILDDDAPDLIYGETVAGDATIRLLLSEPADMTAVGDVSNWSVSPGYTVTKVATTTSDLFIGKTDGRINHYRNYGELNFSLETEQFAGIDVGNDASPVFVDIDADNDLDLFIGESGGRLHYYKNNGTATAPDYSQESTYFNLIDVGSQSRPFFADLNANGKYDLLIGGASGKIHYFQNVGTPTSPIFLFISDNAFDIDVGVDASPFLVDIDADGDLDLFIGNSLGQIHYYKNRGYSKIPMFLLEEIYTADHWTYIVANAIPVFADIENDGDFDLFIGNIDGQVHFCRNNGTLSTQYIVLEEVNFANINVSNLHYIAFANLYNPLSKDNIVLSVTPDISNTASQLAVTATMLEDYYGNSVGPVSISFYPDDGNNNPTLESTFSQPEIGGDVSIPYTISDGENDAVSLRCEYSTDKGQAWQLMTLSGDTTELGSGQYNGSITWHTATDFPNTEQDSVLLRITPRDADPRNDGIAFTSTYFTVDNNTPPAVQVYPLIGEQKEDIALYFQLSDSEDDSLAIEVKYQTDDSQAWQPATTDKASKYAAADSLMLTWSTFQDLPTFAGFVWFRIQPADNDPGKADSTRIFLDNIGVPAMQPLAAMSGEKSGDIRFDYRIDDDEGDAVSIRAEYSRDSSIWAMATIAGDTNQLGPANYSGFLQWRSSTDLAGIDDESVWFRLTPYDRNPGYPAISNAFHVDNNAIPVLSISSPSGAQSARIRIQVELSDSENDTLHLHWRYRQNQELWSAWESDPGHVYPPTEYPDIVEIATSTQFGFGQFSGYQYQFVATDNDSSEAQTTNPMDIYIFAGDYNGDIAIDANDLFAFGEAWRSQQSALEIGPATGTPPLLLPVPDGKLDFEDLMVFAQMWNWSFDNPNYPARPGVVGKQAAPASLTLKRSDIGHMPASQSRRLHILRALPPLPAPTSSTQQKHGEIDLEQSEFLPWEGHVADELVLNIPSRQTIYGLALQIDMDPGLVQIARMDHPQLAAIEGFILRADDVENGRYLLHRVALEEPETGASLLRLQVLFLAEGRIPIKLRWLATGADGSHCSEGQTEIAVDGHFALPQQFTLHQNFPNPFNPSTTIRYEMPVAGEVHMEVYNVLGQRVALLVNAAQEAGYQQFIWNSTKTGHQASGMYILRLDIRGDNGQRFTSHKKMLLIK